MIKHKLYLYIFIMLQYGCLNKKNNVSKQIIPNINNATLIALDNFQKEVALSESVINKNKQKTKYNYNLVCKDDFKYHFNFMSDSTSKAMLNLFDKNIFKSIRLSSKDCIHFFINTTSIEYSMEWTETYLIYSNHFEQRCYRGINDVYNIPEENIIKINEYWSIVIVQKKRIIRG